MIARRPLPSILLLLLALPVVPAIAGDSPTAAELDARVEAFLAAHRDDWHDMNVPASDGQRLHDLIVEHGFRNALEIGTSTGHSAVWMAWALSKTGGRLTTLEIDADRHRAALANFAEAGLAPHIDARLGDAHRMVPELAGPFDLVFNDADKEWYTNYFAALSPKLAVGGCFVAHNASMRQSGVREFLQHVQALPNYQTTIDRSSGAGMSISCKTAPDP